MIPLRDTAPRKGFPFLTYFLIGVNVFVFFYMFTLSKGELDFLIQNYALIPAFVGQGLNLHTFFTSLFLHGSLVHLFGNMLFLHIFGDNVEAKLGKLRFLLFYLVCGVAGCLSQIVLNPSSQIPNLGASGAIAGLMGAYLYFFPKAKVEVLVPIFIFYRVVKMPAFFMLGYWFLFQALSGLGSLGYANLGGVAYFAHIGGFLSGFLIAIFCKKRFK